MPPSTTENLPGDIIPPSAGPLTTQPDSEMSPSTMENLPDHTTQPDPEMQPPSAGPLTTQPDSEMSPSTMENLPNHMQPPSAGPLTTPPDSGMSPLHSPETEKVGEHSTSSNSSSSRPLGRNQSLSNSSSTNKELLFARSASGDVSAGEKESEDRIIPLCDVSRSLNERDLRHRKPFGSMTTDPGKTPLEKMALERRSTSIDLETGKEGGSRSQCALIREEYEREPQSRRRRGIRKIVKFITKPFRKDEAPIEDQMRKAHKEKFKDAKANITRRTVAIPQGDDTQYQIFSIDEAFGKGVKGISDDRKKKCCGFKNRFCSFSTEHVVTSYLFWAFRSSFLAVLINAGVFFALCIFAFTTLIFICAQQVPHCLYVAGEDFDGRFFDAFGLSWTTFTTVGYGAIYPGTSKTADSIDHCWVVTILSTVESFVGILFASFWGAIFLSKVTRVSSSAQVEFSNPVLIRFGEGVMGNHKGNDSSSDESEEFQMPGLVNYPCPVLEFRLINKMSSQRKGEIIDATLNMVASVASSQIPPRDTNRSSRKKRSRKGKGSKQRGTFRRHDSFSESDSGLSEAALLKCKEITTKILFDASRFDRRVSKNDAVVRREFAKLFVESQDHPFFKRVWVARHILDQDSPLVTNEAKKVIKMHGGRWPSEINNAMAVRACVNFDQILVSLSGTSNADANTVYAQKIYDYSSLVVGYRFCNILYREIDGSLGVDANLLNDVLEQKGGGGENMDRTDIAYSFRRSKTDIVIL